MVFVLVYVILAFYSDVMLDQAGFCQQPPKANSAFYPSGVGKIW